MCVCACLRAIRRSQHTQRWKLKAIQESWNKIFMWIWFLSAINVFASKCSVRCGFVFSSLFFRFPFCWIGLVKWMWMWRVTISIASEYLSVVSNSNLYDNIAYFECRALAISLRSLVISLYLSLCVYLCLTPFSTPSSSPSSSLPSGLLSYCDMIFWWFFILVC